MGAALVRVDVVDEREHVLLVARVVAHRQLDGHVGVGVFDHDGVLQEALARLVEVVHELGQAALGVVGLDAQLLIVLALVGQRDRDALVEVGQLAHPGRQRVEAVDGVEEDRGVGLEQDGRAGLLAVGHVADAPQRLGRVAALEGHLEHALVAPDGHLQPVAQRVHAAHADAVQAARDLVGVLVELAAGVEHRHHDLDGRLALGRVHRDRDAAAVVGDRDRVVTVDHDLDVVAVAGERLVDRVVDDLVDQVVQPTHAHVADVHGRPLADGPPGLRAPGCCRRRSRRARPAAR